MNQLKKIPFLTSLPSPSRQPRDYPARVTTTPYLRVDLHGERPCLQTRDVVPDQAKHGLILRDVGHPLQVNVVVNEGGDVDEPSHVLQRSVQQRQRARDPGDRVEREEAA
jgi:hypothetical protein